MLYIAHSFVIRDISPLTNTLALRESSRQEFSSPDREWESLREKKLAFSPLLRPTNEKYDRSY